MPNDRAYENAEDQLTQDFNDGRIDLATYNAEMRGMASDYRAELEDEAQAAYDAVMWR